MMQGDSMQEDSMMPVERGAMERMDNPDAMAREEAHYADYRNGIIGNGEESVLFFHASWCPECKKADGSLQSWYPSNDLIPVYKVDYDTETALKSRFGIVQQHTFVRLDGRGNVVKVVIGPSDSALRSLLSVS